MAIHHREVNSLTGRKWFPSQVLWQTLVSLDELSACTGIVLGEQLFYGHRDLAEVSTIPPRVCETELQGFNEEVEIGRAVVLNICNKMTNGHTYQPD